MSEYDVLIDPNYQRGYFMLMQQINCVEDLVALWVLYGSCASKQIPEIEKVYPWWHL